MPQITVYTRSTCAPCKMVKTWLANKGYSFDERNVDEDPQLMDEIMTRTGFRMVPVTQIGDTFVSGMNIGAIASHLTDNR